MSSPNGSEEQVTTVRKERKLKTSPYVPPSMRGLSKTKKDSGNSSEDCPANESKSANGIMKPYPTKTNHASNSVGYKVRIPKMTNNNDSTSGSSSISEPEDKKGRLCDPVPNCCEELEEGELEISPLKEVNAENSPSAQFKKLVVNKSLSKPETSNGETISSAVTKEGTTGKVPYGKFPTSDSSTFLVKRNSEKMKDKKRNKSPKSDKNDENEFTVEEFLNINASFFDSHCHTDFIYNYMNCKNSAEGLKLWMNKYPKAFPKRFLGCIANFINPNLYVENEKTMASYDIEWIEKELAECRSYVATTWGCHPHYTELWENNDNFWNILNQIFSNKQYKVKAVGECGIDLHRCEAKLETQKHVFRRQIQLAFKFDLALVIHCRKGAKGDAEGICLEIVKEELEKNHRYLRIHRHCYNENWKNAQKWIEVCPNIVFGFTPGVFTFRDEQIEAIRSIPLDRIILETDAPFFKPKQFENICHPKVSMPGIAASVAFKIAKVKNVPVEEVLRAAENNTRRIYDL